ncbi:TonB family protein [Undibacterium sp. WLX3042]|uniref:TonB family protein n=1 Tax=Undibacterium sp. WLX3042 TaxID=3412686 RepID=UPI003C2CFC7D
MNLFPVKTEHPLPDEIKKRLTGGLLISLLVHAFILSLQFGLPGVGLPGLEVPWDKRRAETAPVSVQIADAAPASAASVVASIPAPVASDISHTDPVAAANGATQTLSSAPSQMPPLTASPQASAVGAITPTRKSGVTQGIQLLAPSVPAVSVPVPEKKISSKAAKVKKSVTRIPAQMPRPPRVVALDVPDIITQNSVRNETFSVAVRDPEESKKEPVQREEPKPFPDPVSQSGEDLSESPPVVVSRYERDVQQRERHQEKILQATRELLQETIPLPASAQQSMKQMEEASRQQVAEAARAEADAALALKQQQEAGQQQQRILQEAGKANASALAAMALQRSDNLKLVDDSLRQQMQLEIAAREQQRKERQAAILAARQQAEEREEELKRQQEEALRRQQMEMQIAQARNEALQERQKIEKMAEQQAQQKIQQQALQQAQEAQQKTLQERLEKQRAEDSRQQAAQVQQRERELAALAAGADKTAKAIELTAIAGKVGGGSSAGKAAVASNPNTVAGSAAGNATGSGDTTASFVLPRSLLSSDLANRSREQARGLDLLRGAPPLPRADTEERPRRRSVLGSAEKDIQLRMYVDSWKQKIERNGNLNFSQTSRDKARGDPVVTVAIRSDGSVEEVTIHRSSGRADLDQAVRNIVRINARYAAFPPNIAAQYDVIEVRRVWNFDDGLRLLEELR